MKHLTELEAVTDDQWASMNAAQIGKMIGCPKTTVDLFRHMRRKPMNSRPATRMAELHDAQWVLMNNSQIARLTGCTPAAVFAHREKFGKPKHDQAFILNNQIICAAMKAWDLKTSTEAAPG